MSQSDNLLNLDYARNPLQKANMEKILKEKLCPFCPEHLKKYHTPPVVKTGKYWYVTPNMYPYENTAHHLLFVTNEHISDSKKLSTAAWAELQELTNWVAEEYKIDGGTLIMRSGDMNKTGSTVSHLHAQLVVASDKNKPVITRVG